MVERTGKVNQLPRRNETQGVLRSRRKLSFKQGKDLQLQTSLNIVFFIWIQKQLTTFLDTKLGHKIYYLTW